MQGRDSWQVLVGDALANLKTLTSDSVHCCVTSPPYFGLRDYGVAGQIGLEPDPAEYVVRLQEVFHEVQRVLRPDGTLWLVLGDSYARSAKKGQHKPGDRGKQAYIYDRGNGRASAALHLASEAAGSRNGRIRQGDRAPVRVCGDALKPKDLIGIPWMVAFALREDGWYLRSDVIWEKPNVLPESVRDRPTKAHEYVFLFSKSERYYYDHEAIKEPCVMKPQRRLTPRLKNPSVKGHQMPLHRRPEGSTGGGTRNARTVWEICPKPYKGAHFAVFPEELVERCLLAATSAGGCCAACGTPFARAVSQYTSLESGPGRAGRTPAEVNANGKWAGKQYGTNLKLGPVVYTDTKGWHAACKCPSPREAPCVVLDPFMGSGTTGIVADKLGHRFIGNELNPEYVELAKERRAQAKSSRSNQ